MNKSQVQECVDPLIKIIKTRDGVDECFHTVKGNFCWLKVLVHDANTLKHLLNVMTYGSCKWNTFVYSTETHEQVEFLATVNLTEFSLEDFKREIDYKVCLFKMH